MGWVHVRADSEAERSLRRVLDAPGCRLFKRCRTS